MSVIRGTPQEDNITGSSERDIIYTFDGDDKINGAEGDDLLYGGSGNDTEVGGEGNDYLFGNQGNDSLEGDEGNDILSGGVGDDSLNGGKGNDLLSGDQGNDILQTDDGASTVRGGFGDDTFSLTGSGSPSLASAVVITDFGSGQDVLQFSDGRQLLSQGKRIIDLSSLSANLSNLRIFQGNENYAKDAIIQDRQSQQFLAILKDVLVIGGTTPSTVTPTPTPIPTSTPTPTPTLVNQPPIEIKLFPTRIIENSSNTTLVGRFTTIDPNIGDVFSYQLVNDAQGRFAISGNQLIVAPNNTFTDFQANQSYTITVLSTDQGGLSVNKNLTLQVNKVNQPPIALADTIIPNILTGTPGPDSLAATQPGIFQPLEIPAATLLANDSDPNGEITEVSNATKGTVKLSGTTIIFTPNVNPVNTGSFQYTISDGFLTATAPVTVNIQAVQVIKGFGSDDTILGGLSDDTIDGGSENDRLQGDAGNDSIIGSLGDDTLSGDLDNDTLTGGDGNDVIQGGINPDPNSQTGLRGDGNDLIFGDAGNDTLLGDFGSDTIVGGDGNDLLQGGADSLGSSGDLNDSIMGGLGDDTLVGDFGDDTLIGEAGNDFLQEITTTSNQDGDGNDLMIGDAGNDTIVAAFGNNTLIGGEGNDFLEVTGSSPLVGRNNFLKGDDGSDTLIGTFGENNTLMGGLGTDILQGRLSSTDFFVYTATSEGDVGETILNFETGVDLIVFSAPANFGFSGTGTVLTNFAKGDSVTAAELNLSNSPGILAVGSGTIVDIYYDSNGSTFGSSTFLFRMQGVSFNNLDTNSFQLIRES